MMRKTWLMATAAASIAFGATVGFSLLPTPISAQSAASGSKSSDTYRQLSLFGEVFERVRAEYVEPVTDEALIEAAINGMLASLDPHSSFMNAKGFKDMQSQTRGEFGGLGIEVSMENGLVKVVSPIDDTPAYRAGLKPGDFITHLNGEGVLGMTLNEAVDKMRGQVGTPIKITIRRDGTPDPFDVTLTRAVIKVESVRGRLEGGDIAVIRISSFTEQTTSGLQRQYQKLAEQAGGKLKGMVLDLRNNPGGLLDQAVSVSDFFLDKGEIVSTRSRKAEDVVRFNAKGADETKGMPVVVLINGGSASASEIVAGALQDHRRAIIMGTRSFGKGSVQTIMPLGQQGAMRLTTARYYTPSGRSIQQKGIDPDIEVQEAKIEVTEPTTRRREADLRGSLRNPQGGAAQPDKPAGEGDKPANGEPKPAAETPAKPPQDYQLARALDMIRGLALVTGRDKN